MKHHPNILFIMAERIRYDCIGSSQVRLSKTPYLDWLAGNGVWFEQAYTPNPNLGLAQSILLSGERVNANYYFPYEKSLSPRAVIKFKDNWSNWLSDRNWLCSWLGKWQISGYEPADFGYEKADDIKSDKPSDIAESAIQWLRKNGQQGLPWHLCLNFPDYMPSEDIKNDQPVPLSPWPNFTDDMQNKPMAQKRLQERCSSTHNLWSEWSERAANSVAQATRLDDAVGNLVAQINQMGLLEDTLIIFTAASGSMCGSHKLIGNEYVCYDEVMRVPMLLHWPGIIPAGLRCDKLVSSLLDLPATLISLLQDRKLERLQGFDLSCFWSKGKSESGFCNRDGIMSSQLGLSQGLYTQRMFRDSRFKYIWNPTDLDELYDLQKDPYELINRIETDVDEAARLKALMLTEMIRCDDPLIRVMQTEMEGKGQ